MNILSLFSFAIFAAESILSPLPPDYQAPPELPSKPIVSFSELPVPVTPTPSPTPSPTPTPTGTPPPTPTPKQTRKQAVTIALLGDSMIDTLGPTMPYLTQTLKKTYPNTTFVVKNHGVGGIPIASGIDRIPTVASSNPDVIVLESFAYNVSGTTDQGEIDHHWLELARAVDAIQTGIPHAKIVIAATIAPNSIRFGDGAPGLAFSPEDKIARTGMIKKYIETTVKFAQSEHLPLANAFSSSLDSSGNGKLVYINSGDHIHYSDAGRLLMESKIAGSIIANKLLE